MRRSLCLAVLTLVALAAVPAGAAAAPGDTARYILPPGNYGGLPTTQNSLDQLPLYDGLTPLRGQVSGRDINRLFLPENFKPIGARRVEPTGRPGLRIVYDEYGVPHIYGKKRSDVSFGAGWVTARDRALLITLARGPSRVAVADVPGIDAFSLVTSGQSFEASPETEALVTAQRRLLVRTYGAKGRQIIADAQAYADGINAYWQANNVNERPATVNDVLAVTAFIGSIFGAGGGGEARNSDLLARLRGSLGQTRGQAAWEDVMLANDPEAPTTINRRFPYGPLTGGRVRGSVVIDPGSIQEFDPTAAPAGAAVDAASAPPRRRASNFLAVAPERSRSGNSLAVMGPQLGYYYPEIVQQMHLEGPGIKAQGAAVPGLAMYILIGRTENYAWSLTSAGHDVRDVYAEQLCEPGGGQPTRASASYLYKGSCRPLEDFNAGLLAGRPLRFRKSVHGPIIGTALVGGRPYALARKRSTFGRDALNLAALKDMTEGKASTPRRFYRTANQFEFTFNWAYVSRGGDGELLVRSAARASPRPGPPAAHARHGALRVARLPGPERAPARGQRPRRSAAQLEQPLGAGLHARRRRALRVRAAGGAVRPLPAPRDGHRQRGRHEPGSYRGRALAGVAGGEQGAARRQPADPAGRAGEGDPRPVGAPRRPAPRRRQQRLLRQPRPDDHGRGLAPDRRCGDATGVQR